LQVLPLSNYDIIFILTVKVQTEGGEEEILELRTGHKGGKVLRGTYKLRGC